MKRTWLTTFGLAGAIATPAWSQSTVTLSGVMDLAARSVGNEGRGTVRSLVSGANATSRLVVRGSEDLGGGLGAGFHLEHGIAADSGSPTTAALFWDRRSTLSLTDKSRGELRAGRDFVPTYVNWGRFDPFGYVGVASASNFVSATPIGPIRAALGTGLNTTVRSSNSLQWLMPGGWGGIEGSVMVAAGEGGTAASGQHRLVGARLGYAAGPLAVSLASASTRNDLTTAGSFKDLALAGSYDFGLVKLSAGWRRFELASAKQTNLLLGAVVPVGSGELKLSWNKADMDGSVGATGIAANGANQLGVGYVHPLSKRTAVYTSYARVSNDGASTYVVPGGPTGLAGGGRSPGFEAGLRHLF